MSEVERLKKIESRILDELRRKRSADIEGLAHLVGMSVEDCIQCVRNLALKGKLAVCVTADTIVERLF